jgi:hypothetical protein
MVLLKYRWEALLGGMIIGEEMIRYGEYIMIQTKQLHMDLLLSAVVLVVYFCAMLCFRSDRSLRWLLVEVTPLAMRGRRLELRTLLEKGMVSGGFLYMLGMPLLRENQKATILNLLCLAVVVLVLLIPRLVRKQ